MSKNIHIVMTGGTIDSVWDGARDTVVVSTHSIIPEYFENLSRNLKFYTELEFTEICMKDSRALNPEDRQKLLKTIENSTATKIIVTHGTYTMSTSAKYLEDNLQKKDKTIVLTGSMVPIKGFNDSDGPFNLGYAIAQVQTLPPGVYVCMNARIFTSDEVAKNISAGIFYSTFTDKQ